MSHHPLRRLLPILSIALLVTPALAERPGDPMVGAQLGQSMCSSCHAVGATGRGTDMAPTLPAVAAARNDDDLTLFLADPHGAMPPITLTRQQIADLVAWLGTLRPERPPTGSN